MSCNGTQSRAVTGLLPGHNTLRRYLHLVGLSDSPLCSRCAAEVETSAHTLCECEAKASLRHAYLGSFFLETEDINCVSLGGIWNFSKATGAPIHRYGAQRARQLRPRCVGTVRSRNQSQINEFNSTRASNTISIASSTV